MRKRKEKRKEKETKENLCNNKKGSSIWVFHSFLYEKSGWWVKFAKARIKSTKKEDHWINHRMKKLVQREGSNRAISPLNGSAGVITTNIYQKTVHEGGKWRKENRILCCGWRRRGQCSCPRIHLHSSRSKGNRRMNSSPTSSLARKDLLLSLSSTGPLVGCLKLSKTSKKNDFYYGTKRKFWWIRFT